MASSDTLRLFRAGLVQLSSVSEPVSSARQAKNELNIAREPSREKCTFSRCFAENFLNIF